MRRTPCKLVNLQKVVGISTDPKQKILEKANELYLQVFVDFTQQVVKIVNIVFLLSTHKFVCTAIRLSTC